MGRGAIDERSRVRRQLASVRKLEYPNPSRYNDFPIGSATAVDVGRKGKLRKLLPLKIHLPTVT